MDLYWFFQGLSLGGGIYLALNGAKHIRQRTQKDNDEEVAHGFKKLFLSSIFFIVLLLFTVIKLDLPVFITVPLIFAFLFQILIITHFLCAFNK